MTMTTRTRTTERLAATGPVTVTLDLSGWQVDRLIALLDANARRIEDRISRNPDLQIPRADRVIEDAIRYRLHQALTHTLDLADGDR